jgi:F0F1-type ATP synthase epsilon subunit
MIMSPTESHDHKVSWIRVETSQGDFVIQDGHAPTIVTLEHGNTMTYELTDGTEKSLSVEQGILHVNRTEATLIISEESDEDDE